MGGSEAAAGDVDIYSQSDCQAGTEHLRGQSDLRPAWQSLGAEARFLVPLTPRVPGCGGGQAALPATHTAGKPSTEPATF